MTAPAEEPPDLTWNELCDKGAEQLHAPPPKMSRDVRGQGLTRGKLNTMDAVDLEGDYL